MARTEFDVTCRVLLAAQLAITLISYPAVPEDKICRRASDDIEQRVQRVVNGLRPAVIVAGQAADEVLRRG